MEAFQLLSRGGAKFDKNRFKNDVNLFNKSKHVSAQEKSKTAQVEGDLPLELDFFKYAEGGSGKRKATAGGEPQLKKRKTNDAGEDSDEESEAAVDTPVPPKQRHRVTTKGSNVPEHADTFEQMRERYNLSSLILSNLTKNGYAHPTGIQSYGIPILLEARDLAAISPTGTGKTLSYLLPILASLGSPISSSTADNSSGVRGLIVAPTRELAHQIHNECLKLAEGRKWRIVLFSKATANTMSDKNARDKTDILISTPLRLVAALQSGNIDLHNVRHLILDEADRMLDAEFLPQIQEIRNASAGAEKIAMEMLCDPIRVVVGLKDTPLPLISQTLTYVADDPSKLPSLLAYLSQPYNPPVLIFTSSQPGESWVMVSTEVMARGMDFKGVREVINYDFPTATGRAGREGKAVTYFTNEDAPYLKS
ncbi:P-loop containing nucleoside triphosphate hydrolase protein [Infundibulicybe gibba]|nr:P-loop containing nucleoside triphosphate hydrolase protein [Infundibulicybe gibba]